MYLRSNGPLPVSFVSTTSLDVVRVATVVHQFVSPSLCGIFYNLELEAESGRLLLLLLEGVDLILLLKRLNVP